MASDKPKARPRHTTYVPPTEETGKKPTPSPLPSAAKPSVNHAPKRTPYPKAKEPKKPRQKAPKASVEGVIKQGVKAATEQAKTILFKDAQTGSKRPSSFQKRSNGNPTNATTTNATQVAEPKTLEQMLSELAGPISLQLPEVNANLRGRRPKINQLTPKILKTICLLIRAGSYDQDAARAAGIAPRTWRAWLDKGEEDIEANHNTAYAQLFQLIDKATGEAIVLKSIQATTDDPKFYLTHGPGKTRPGREGWSPSVKIEGGADPIRVEHEHGGKIEIEGSPHLVINLNQQSGQDAVAEAFANLQELGIMLPQKLLESVKQPIEVKPIKEKK